MEVVVGGGVVLGGGAMEGFEVLVEAVEGPARSDSGGLGSAMVARARREMQRKKIKPEPEPERRRQERRLCMWLRRCETRASLRDALWRFAESKIIDGLATEGTAVKVAHD